MWWFTNKLAEIDLGFKEKKFFPKDETGVENSLLMLSDFSIPS